MSNDPMDVFADLDLAEFKKPVKRQLNVKSSTTEKEAIRAVAEENKFQSREPIKARGKKVIPKTFSLFEEDCDVINSAIRGYLLSSNPGRFQPSGSDVVRAALHFFIEQPTEEQIKQIKERRGRGHK